MTSPWTEPDEGGGLTRNQWIGLGVFFVAALGFAVWAWLVPKESAPLDADVIVGDWQAADPQWSLTFRPDKTVELIYSGSAVPETLAPTVVTPGVPVAGKFVRWDKGIYRFKLDNGKTYEAAIGKFKIRKDDKFVDQYIKDRIDVTDVDGSSAVVVFYRVAKPSVSTEAVPGSE